MPSLLNTHDEAPTGVDSNGPDEGHDEWLDETPEPIRVASVLVLLRRRYLVILTATLAVAAAALALTLSAEKRYEASTSVLLPRQNPTARSWHRSRRDGRWPQTSSSSNSGR